MKRRKRIDEAAYQLAFLIEIEGISTLARGGKDCVYRALEALRPDIAEVYADDPNTDLIHRFFPDRCA